MAPQKLAAAARAPPGGATATARRKARKGRHPRTGEPIRIKASNGVRFKPGKKLREAV